ncbi:hypothetical protein FAZ95_28965 [Trinickia violacea]|uniref:Uncharacterized protein n=1 Tax=Trinickia violacea TaxID=2571746 RepID=A0A4P8IYP8_9BURK|nr:hypothetical protein [Trinickia violacea]QCP53115.1 hypothetical protein FAZ95_28965 [Trinickia violacea]
MIPASSADVGSTSVWLSPPVVAALVAAIVALLTALITAFVTVGVAERKLRRDFRLEFAAEGVAHQLMMDPEWSLRSFAVIKHHLGGFDDDDLRRILVRAGAIRFSSPSGKELWGLLERNHHLLGATTISEEPGHRSGKTQG